jgi:UDP-glucose:(heptosyl)LPS alpha-1,3-glucosyltransferase
VVYNGVDTGRFSPDRRAEFRQPVRQQLGIGDDVILALFVGHNFWLKGLPTLLRAVRRLATESLPVHLAVVGGKQKHVRRWRHAARQMGVEESVTFAGPKDDTVPYYAAADVYVQPTFYDPCSLVLLEAAASGLPIITTRFFNGAAELMTEGVESLLVSDPTDSDQVANQMRVMLDSSFRDEMGRAARRMSLRHTFCRNVEEMLDVYREARQSACRTAS